MITGFTDQELVLLKGKASSIAAKHNCSSEYVRLIMKGERKVDTEKAKKIFHDLKSLIELLSIED